MKFNSTVVLIVIAIPNTHNLATVHEVQQYGSSDSNCHT